MPRPRGPRGGAQEKPKNFWGSMKRLLKNLNSWKFLLIFGLILACASSVLALIAPNKLSDFTDEISKGLVPNTEVLTKISKKMTSNFNEENIVKASTEIMTSDKLSIEEKSKYKEVLSKMSTLENKEDASKLLLTLPNNVLKYYLADFKIDGQTITVKDQLELMKLTSKMKGEKSTENALKLIDEMPKSVKKLVEPTIDMKEIKTIGFGLGLIYFISALFGYIQSFSMTTVSNNFAKKLRRNISNKINKLPLRYFDTHENGDVLSRVTNDVDTISMNLNNSLATLVSSTTLFVGSIIMMFVTNWLMAITAIL